MGRGGEKSRHRSHTLPSSPAHSLSSSSSSSDFEFTISLSPRKSSTNLCPADELFYKGQLLPLHLSPRLSMVRTLLLRTSSTTSSSTTTTTTTTASRHSTGSSTDSRSSFSGDLICDSSRPSSVSTAEEDELRRLNHHPHHHHIKKTKYSSAFSRFSSVFRKEPKTHDPDILSGSSMKRTAKEVICKYFKKVKPLYEKLSQKNQQKTTTTTDAFIKHRDTSMQINRRKDENGSLSHSFSGNLRYPRRKRSCASSCPSSMRSSPSRSGIACRNGFPARSISHVDTSIEELQSAIQGAIAHCKNSMIENKTMVGN
ncbi:probable membrane-associated kinase regulator 1 [Cornus florida]|uniref:probable membrane-associated kinase regulator 1 n=1 Tax=Cornus florida TaxID=4283 RepID=UPI002897DD1D|nr:probable membrane-associated kinase regulator 1 [Cornus florida]